MSSGLGISGGYAAPAPGPVAYSNLPDGAFNSPSIQRKHAHSADMISLIPREAPEALMTSAAPRLEAQAEPHSTVHHPTVKRSDTSAITGAEIGGLLLLGSATAGGGVYLISKAIDHSNAKKAKASQAVHLAGRY